MYKKFEIKIIISTFTGQKPRLEKIKIDMEIKKTEKASLENKKFFFLEIGLVISLLITFLAFEYKQKETTVSTLEDETQVEIEEERRR